MDEQIISRAYLSKRHFNKGRQAALAGLSHDSHDLPALSAAVDDWLAGWRSATPPQSHVAAPVRARFDVRQAGA